MTAPRMPAPEEREAAFAAWKASLHHARCAYVQHSVFPPADCSGKIVRVRPMTLYGDEPEFYELCEAHAAEYVEHWTERWAEYHAGLL